ncbi:uncharacterized protein LOC127705818 [Mytilus californianus]|uniref:uncharacterized protein LOC127705818 n=1 Tax=Mytilus californianus TaxID=6549 RepID=UPI00224635FE|nr:uncharacterized protein LOC127705818 [Mytilus californianus]
MVKGVQRTITLLVLFYINVVISSCRNDICFTWKVTVTTLTLTCKVDNLHLSIYIGDPNGKLQADCLPPSQPNNCEPYYKNSSVIQYKSTNETVFQVNGYIDYSVNGNWTCRHGTRKEIATVEVSVLRIKGENNETAKDILCQIDFDCTKSSLLWSMISYFSFVMICVVLISTGVRICSFRRADDMVNKLIIRVIRNQTKLSVCKRIFFIIFTVTFFSLVVFSNMLHQKRCPLQFVFVCLGVIFGIINSVLFLNKDEITNNIPNQDEEFPDSQRLSRNNEVNESDL